LAPARVVLAAQPKAFKAALRLYDGLEYEKAAPRFNRLVKNKRLPAKTRALSAVYLGIIDLTMGRNERADADFATALSLDPEVKIPGDASPTILEAFEAAKQKAGVGVEAGGEGADEGSDAEGAEGEGEGDAGMTGTSGSTPPPYGGSAPIGSEDPEGETGDLPPPPTAVAPAPLMHHQSPPPSKSTGKIVITLDPLRRVSVDKVLVHFRRSGESFWFTRDASMAEKDRYEAEIPAPNDDGGIEYYLEAASLDGTVHASLASAVEPYRYDLPKRAAPEGAVKVAGAGKAPGQAKQWYQQWWVWAGGGAVAAGLIAGVIVASTGGCKAPDGQGCFEVSIR